MQKVSINHRYSEFVLNESWQEEYDDKFWNYREMWRNVPQEQILTEFPMHLDIGITNVCDLKCPMCPRTLMLKKGYNFKPYYIDFNVFKTAIDMGYNKGLYAINLNAAGEPLFHSQIARMVEYAKQKGILDVFFHTNATLLTEKKSEDLIKSGLDKLIVSFDSPIKEHYEKIRVGADFYKVERNVRKFVEIRNRLNKKTPQVRINMVIMRENEQEQEQMIEFWKGCADSIGFLGCINPLQLDKEHRNIGQTKYNSHFVCEKLWQRLAIEHNGDIKLCHMDEQNLMILGNVFENDIANIWNGKEMNRIRNLHLDGKSSEIPSCKVCGLPFVR